MRSARARTPPTATSQPVCLLPAATAKPGRKFSRTWRDSLHQRPALDGTVQTLSPFNHRPPRNPPSTAPQRRSRLRPPGLHTPLRGEKNSRFLPKTQGHPDNSLRGRALDEAQRLFRPLGPESRLFAAAYIHPDPPKLSSSLSDLEFDTLFQGCLGKAFSSELIPKSLASLRLPLCF